MNAMATQIPNQLYFTEGPVWDPKANVLYLTDMGAPNGGAIYKFTPPSTFDVLLQPAGSADGIGLDPQNNVIAAGYPSRNAWHLSAGMMVPWSPCSGATTTCYMGSTINTPDDITARSDGVIYFTDPTFALTMSGIAPVAAATGSSPPQATYRVTTDGMLHQEDSTGNGPNGVNLSPDEKTLYVAYTLDGNVYKFSVAGDGSLSNKTLFASGLSLADSMCVDAGGNVYVGTQGGLAVLDPSGNQLGTIPAGGTTTNCAFGGADQKTLYITSHGYGAPSMGQGFLYKVDNWPVPGIPGQN
jgi:gluconolactonase